VRPRDWNGWAVILLGGGLVTDESWTVPGSFTDSNSGEEHTFTIDGEPTRDAQAIANELASRGYVVWRWSSVHEDDALHAQDPAMAEPLPFADGIELTSAMVGRFLDLTDGLDGAVLVGHSLGACRAVHAGAEDDRVRGFVFLAGARLTPVPDRPSVVSAQAITETGLDTDGDGVLSGSELSAERAARWDADGDGVVRGWEIAGSEAALAGGWPEPGRESQLDALLGCGKPALAIFGGLDTMSVHGPVLEIEADRAGAPVVVEYATDRGHQLSVERDGKIDDIDPAVVGRLADWIDSLRETSE
jgi:pimeloyl-ACP methyl ester carboxylesterase